MTGINLQQIEEKLNQQFLDYGQRKIIFWFDSNQEFSTDIHSLILEKAKVYYLEENALFKAKRHLEFLDVESNYLIYAPFERWEDKADDNHLLSVLMYSSEFSADKLAILMSDLKIPLKYQTMIKKHQSFFNAKERIQRFESFGNKFTNEETIKLTMMATLIKSPTHRLNDILQNVFQQFVEGEKSPLKELDKYLLSESFWELIKIKFGFAFNEPTIEKLAIYFYLNYFYYQIDQKFPSKFQEFEATYSRSNIITFMDQFMNDARYAQTFDQLSQAVYKAIEGEKLIASIAIDDLLEADVFSPVHERILHFYTERLLSADTTTKVAGKTMLESLKQREKMHFAANYSNHYQMIKHASYLVNKNILSDLLSSKDLLEHYERELYWIDTHYRKFIWNSDCLSDSEPYKQLIRLVESNYGKYLDQAGQLWNKELTFTARPSIRRFYQDVVMSKTVKTIVFISDAFRYELGKELQRQFEKEKKYSTDLQSYFSVLPSVTEFGKAALLPHGKLEYLSGTEVRVDKQKSNGLLKRQAILQAYNEQSFAYNYSEVSDMNKNELREAFIGRSVVYIYHDQVDKTGDHGNEKQIFDACKQAISELFKLIQRVNNDGSVYRFIVTADHGFVYKRDKIAESDKIENPSNDVDDRVERRFIISKNEYDVLGVKSYSLGEVLGNDDKRFVCVPVTSSIFKKAGGGQNYVHGGSSLQEMLVPVLEITAARGSNAKEDVSVDLMTSNRRITGLSTTLEFYQKTPISDVYEPVAYNLFFEDGQGERISNVVNYVANSKEEDANQRFNKFVFEFVNRRYSVDDDYYLVMENQQTTIKERLKFIIDNPFAQAFDFDL